MNEAKKIENQQGNGVLPCVCAQHKLQHTQLQALNKFQKYKFI